MKTFFISVLGTVVGLFVAFFIMLIIVVAIGMAAVKSADKPYSAKENSVLKISLSREIPERSSNNPFQNFDFSSMQDNSEPGLNDILHMIEKAKDDKSIKGIYLDMSSIPAGAATVEEIRNALIDFKTSGKFIYSYGEVYSQKAYYLASVADKIFLHPQGYLEWHGLSAQLMFFKGTLEKLEIQPQIFRHGKYKSAIEPFDLDKMSPSNREQIAAYVNSIWDHSLNRISEPRKLSVEDLDRLADSLLVRTPEAAKQYGMVDELAYMDEFLQILREKLSVKEKDKLNFVELGNYKKSVTKKEQKSKSKIAVIYAVGTIGGGDGDDDTMGSDRISEAIRKARKDSSIKAIVLRVNSPGGSALASDVIWREMILAKKEKPVVVSMGNVAASGGYYIACGADAIVAQPNTITGSIGVFGMLPNMQNFFKNKLGITVDTFKTNNYADLGSTFRPVSSSEQLIIQNEIDRVYNTFVGRVAEGRKMSVVDVDSIAQGRVWTGADAHKIGLVDELGGIGTAIKLAAQKAGLDKYKVVELPKQKDPFEEFVKNISGEVKQNIIKGELGEQYIYYRQLKEVLQMKGVQARMPFYLTVE